MSWKTVQPTAQSFQKHFVYGHSGAEPYGIYHPNSWASRVSSAVGAEEINYGTSGAILARPEYSGQVGGYSTALNFMRPFLPTVTAGQRTVRKVAPYVPVADLVSIQTISNDLGSVSTTKARSAAMAGDTLAAIIAGRARAGAVWGANDVASGSGVGFTFSSGWAVNSAGVQLCTDGVARQATALNETIDFQAPADHQGELVFLFGVGWAFGGQIEFRDITLGTPGTVITTLDCSAQAGGGPAASNIRMTFKKVPIPFGSRKVRAILTGLTGSNDGTAVTTAIFDSVSLTALDNPPLVVLGNHPRGPNSLQADADLINGAIDSAIAQFPDGRVVKADMMRACNSLTVGGIALSDIGAGSRGAIFRAVDGHANEIGHSLQTKVWLSAINSAPRLNFGSFLGVGSPVYRVIQPYNTIIAEACYASGWSAGGISALPSYGVSYTKSKSGLVKLRGSLKKATTPAALDQMLQRLLPAAYRPMEPQIFGAKVLNPTTFALKGEATVTVGIDGALMLTTIGGAVANDVILLDQINYTADGGLVL